MSKFNDRETKADELERATPFSKFVQSPYSSWFLFSISLFFTLIAYSITSKSNQRHMQDLFKFEVAQTLQAIEQRMQGYQQVLRGGIGLFKASEHVNRQEFHDYVTNLAVNKHWPGIQGIGYAVMLKPEEKRSLLIRSSWKALMNLRSFQQENVINTVVFFILSLYR